jgi:class 3 adenylate cyclase
MAILTAHDDIVLSALTEHGGREVKHTGDGIMAVFVSAVGAVRCAIDAQRALARYSGDGADEPIEIRIGIASGEPVGRNGDLFGATVQLAARLCAHAGPSQIVVSGVVADLCLGKRLRFEELGSVALKGFPVDITARLAAWE